MILLTLSFMFFSIFLDKIFTFNDINLLFYSNIIVFIIVSIIGCKIGYCPRGSGMYVIVIYSIFLLIVYYLLFFINIVIQFNNSIKRKNQKQSDTNPPKRDGKKEG